MGFNKETVDTKGIKMWKLAGMITVWIACMAAVSGCSDGNTVMAKPCRTYIVQESEWNAATVSDGIEASADDTKSEMDGMIDEELAEWINNDTDIITEIKAKRKETEMEDEVCAARIVAVGDNLIHMPVLNSGLMPDGTYDYAYMYENIKDDIAWGDLRVINQETILVSNPAEYSSYPRFGSPYAIGEAVIGGGFNLVTCATNHAFDKKETGICNSVDFWRGHKDEISSIGIYDSQEDYDSIAVLDINGIRIACLNYTYDLNGFTLPSDKQYLVKTLYDRDYVADEIKRASEVSDFVIVFPHWGTEYVHKPTSYQKQWARLFADSGAGLIIGTHPHVVEPLEIIVSNDGREVPCYYSLGNFISSQAEIQRILGGMAKVEIEKHGGITSVKSAEMLPVVTHRDNPTKKFYVYMLSEYSDELAERHRLTERGKKVTVAKLQELFDSITSGQ